jgi:hypothetical protein
MNFDPIMKSLEAPIAEKYRASKPKTHCSTFMVYLPENCPLSRNNKDTGSDAIVAGDGRWASW